MWNIGYKLWLQSGEIVVSHLHNFIQSIPVKSITGHRVIVPRIHNDYNAHRFGAQLGYLRAPDANYWIEQVPVELNSSIQPYDWNSYLNQQLRDLYTIPSELVTQSNEHLSIDLLAYQNAKLFRDGINPTHLFEISNKRWAMANPEDFCIYTNGIDKQIISLKPNLLYSFSFTKQELEELEKGWNMKIRQELDELRQEKGIQVTK